MPCVPRSRQVARMAMRGGSTRGNRRCTCRVRGGRPDDIGTGTRPESTLPSPPETRTPRGKLIDTKSTKCTKNDHESIPLRDLRAFRVPSRVLAILAILAMLREIRGLALPELATMPRSPSSGRMAMLPLMASREGAAPMRAKFPCVPDRSWHLGTQGRVACQKPSYFALRARMPGCQVARRWHDGRWAVNPHGGPNGETNRIGRMYRMKQRFGLTRSAHSTAE
jgi:hypothetical protein